MKTIRRVKINKKTSTRSTKLPKSLIRAAGLMKKKRISLANHYKKTRSEW